MKKLFLYIKNIKLRNKILLFFAIWAAWGVVDVNNWQKAPLRDGANFKPYQDSAGMVVRLSDEVSVPFKSGGKTIQEDIDYHNEQSSKSDIPLSNHKYYETVKLFPTVLDCLQKSQWHNPQPDLNKIDWDKIDWEEEAEVCLFRIASSYEKPENIKKWFEIQKFVRVGLEQIKDAYGILTGEQELVGYWECRKHGIRFSRTVVEALLDRMPIPFSCWGQSASVTYDINNKVISESFGTTRE